jgi:hypothetical protein
MIELRNAITPIDPSSTLLTYTLLPAPDPLQVDNPGILTLTVSKSLNSPDGAITCSQIVVTLPEGKSADTLMPDASIKTQVPTDPKGNKLWSAANDDGVITLTPTGTNAGQFRAQGVSFVFSGFTVNHQPGTTTVSIDETASADSAPTPAVRTADLLVPKFPAQFSLTDLTLIDPTTPDIPYGGSAELMWTGTGDGVSYSLEYQPADDGPVMSPAVGSQGPYTADNLTRTGSVTFTLTAEVTVPGRDNPLIVTRQLTVSIETPALKASMQPLFVPPNGLARLEWDALNMVSCTLNPGGLGPPGQVLGKSGVLLFLIPGSPATRLFSITATPAKGEPIGQQFTITVDPNIKANQPGIEAAGQQGPTGQQGSVGNDGGTGGPGLDPVLRKTVPALDLTSNPARIIPITVTGGKGGTGGQGGDPDASGWPGDGGQGGPGGNATLDLTIDPSLGPPAQYIINVLPGPGGDGGWAGGDSVGSPGTRGTPGTATSISIEEVQEEQEGDHD